MKLNKKAVSKMRARILFPMPKAMANVADAFDRADASWGRVHEHEVNGKTVRCDKGTNCTKRR